MEYRIKKINGILNKFAPEFNCVTLNCLKLLFNTGMLSYSKWMCFSYVYERHFFSLIHKYKHIRKCPSEEIDDTPHKHIHTHT